MNIQELSKQAEPPLRTLMLPYAKEWYWTDISNAEIMIYGRPRFDCLDNYLLFHDASLNRMSEADIHRLRQGGLNVCYVYDVLDLENREFTEEGFSAINRDIQAAIKFGFTHILLSNAYLVELVCNEYGKDLQIVISSQLEFNSPRAKVFLTGINDTACISHIVISQNHLNHERLEALFNEFHDRTLLVELDRWSSDIQMIHEHYYNVVYGYYSHEAITYLQDFVKQPHIRRHVKTALELQLWHPGLGHKIGEINASLELIKNNLSAYFARDTGKIRITDLELWQQS